MPSLNQYFELLWARYYQHRGYLAIRETGGFLRGTLPYLLHPALRGRQGKEAAERRLKNEHRKESKPVAERVNEYKGRLPAEAVNHPKHSLRRAPLVY